MLDFETGRRDNKLYVRYAIVQKYLLNDVPYYASLIQKSKGLLHMQIAVHGVYKQKADSECGFMLVDARYHSFGDIFIYN